MRFLIIEGADATGKTSLARQEAKTRGWEYQHFGAPQSKNYFTEYWKPTMKFVRSGSQAVFDRQFVGELVWPTLFGRPSIINNTNLEHLCFLFSLYSTEVRILYRDESGIRSELEKRGEQDQIPLVLESQKLFIAAANKIKYIPVKIINSDIYHAKDKQCILK